MPEPGCWRMYAHRYDNGDLHNLGDRRYVEFHAGKRRVIRLAVTEVPDA